MKKCSLINLVPRFRSAGLALLLMAGVHSALAANYTWDANTGTAGVQDGNATWTATGTNWMTGGINGAPLKGTDAFVIGATTSGTITINAGGTILNYGDSTSNSQLNINQNYTIKGAAAGDGVSFGNVAIAAGKTVNIEAQIGSLGTERAWTVNNGSVLNLSGGGRLLNLTMGSNGTASSAITGIVNITGGDWITGATAAGATHFSGPVNATNCGYLVSGSHATLVINYTGGNILGFEILGGVGGATKPGTSMYFNMNAPSSTLTLARADWVVGEGQATSAGGATVMTLDAGLISGSNDISIRVGGRSGIAWANANGTFTVNSGTVALGGNGGLYLASGSLSTTATAVNSININGGLVKTGPTGGVRFGSNSATTSSGAGSSSTLNIAGGETYIGTAGIYLGSGTTGIAVGVNLSGGTLGALGNWSSALPMVLGTTGGNITFKAANDLNTSYNITLSGALSGNGGLNKTGSGTLTLSGNNSFAGAVALNDGTLTLGHAKGLGNGAGALTVSNGTLNLGGFSVARTGSVALQSGVISNGTLSHDALDFALQSGTISASLAGAAGLNKTTAGTLVLSGNNGFAGVTSLGGGTLALGHANALGATSKVLFAGGALQYSGSNQADYSAIIKDSTAAVVIDTNGQNVTFASTLDSSNSQGLTKNGSGTLTLAAVNNYGGATTINSGTLAISGAGTLAAGDLNLDEGALNLGATSQSVGAVNLLSSGSIGNGTLTGASYNANGAGSTTISAILSGTGALTKNGSGWLTLSGSNTYSGGTILNSGTILVSTGTALGTGTTNLAGGNLQINGNITLATKINVTQESTISVPFNNMTSLTGTFSGVNQRVNFDIPKTLSFTANQAAFTGTFALVNSGTLLIQSTNYQDAKGDGIHFDLGQNGAMQVGFAVDTRTLNLGALSGGAGAKLGGNGPHGVSYAIGQLGKDSTFAGSISDGLATPTGTTNISVVGGSLTLTGTNTYKGTTTVQGGSLILHGSLTASSQVLVGGTTNLTQSSILGGSGVIANSVIIGGTAGNTGAKLAPHQGTLSTSTGVILTTGSLAINTDAHLALQIGRTTAGTSIAGDVSDKVQVTDLTLNDADLELSLLSTTGYQVAAGDLLFLVINNGGSVNGTFASVNGISLNGGNAFSLGGIDYLISYNANGPSGSFTGGNDVALLAVPEPSTWTMLLGGFGMLLSFQRMRRRNGIR